MSRRFCSFLLALLLIITLSVPTLAVAFPNAEERDGNTYIETFMVAEASDLYRTFWDDWKHSSRNILISGAGGITYWFIIVPEGATVKITEKAGGSNFFEMTINKACDFLYFADSETDSHAIEIVNMGTVAANTPIGSPRYVVCGTYFDGYSFPSLSFDYLVSDYTGSLVLVDDIEGDTEDDDGILGWLKNIWDWLSSFWDTLKAFFLNLFVPREGYFDDWFRVIREAFEKKLGGLGTVIEDIKAAFQGLEGAENSLMVGFPAGILYKGSPAAMVNLADYLVNFRNYIRPIFTGLIVLITAIFSYRRLIALTNH